MDYEAVELVQKGMDASATQQAHQELRDAEKISGEWSELLHRIARQAVRERESGRRQYIRYFESELEATRL